MHPVLLELGPLTIHTYGFMIAFGYIVSTIVVRRHANQDGLDGQRVVDFTFWLLVVGFAGSRVLFIITRWSAFAADPIAMFKIWEGGFVYFGGLLAAVPFTYWYLKKHNLPAWKTTDNMIGMVLIHVFGRLGCLGAGCCYGKPTGADWGLKLHSPLVDTAMRGIPLHPTQIYSSLANLMIFLGLAWLRKRKSFDGQVVLTYFMVYPIVRSTVEMFRGDVIRGFVIEGVLSTSQFISILVFFAGAAIMYNRLKAARAEAS